MLLVLVQVAQKWENNSQTAPNGSQEQTLCTLQQSTSHLFYIVLAHSIQSTTEIQAWL